MVRWIPTVFGQRLTQNRSINHNRNNVTTSFCRSKWQSTVDVLYLQAAGILYVVRNEKNKSRYCVEKEKSWHFKQSNLSLFRHFCYEMNSTWAHRGESTTVDFSITMECWKWSNPSYVMFERQIYYFSALPLLSAYTYINKIYVYSGVRNWSAEPRIQSNRIKRSNKCCLCFYRFYFCLCESEEFCSFQFFLF